MIINGSFAMLRNLTENKFHPILFSEYPMSGPDDSNKPVRMKSFGHHTTGFDTREEAIANMDEFMEKEPAIIRKQTDVEDDIVWNGEEIPAMIAFLQNDKLIFL